MIRMIAAAAALALLSACSNGYQPDWNGLARASAMTSVQSPPPMYVYQTQPMYSPPQMTTCQRNGRTIQCY